MKNQLITGRYRLQYRGTECLNCSHPLDISDRYCPNCSQINSTKKLSLRDFIDEFFSSLISYDSRLLRTLAALILRPGRITLDYVEGKRVRYTNPFRFLLSLAIIYFLMISLSGDLSSLDQYGQGGRNKIDALVNAAQAEQLAAGTAQDTTFSLADVGAIIDRRDSTILADPSGYFNNIREEGLLSRISAKSDFFQTLIRKDSVYSLSEAAENYGLEDRRENSIAFNAAHSILRVSREPGSFLNSLLSKLPFATFFFLPVFALFIWMVYIRKRYTYTDNLVFSFHNQSLFFILLIVNFLTDSIFGWNSAWFFILVFSFYLYKAMRSFYREGRFKTILKYLFLNSIFFILASMASLALLLGSALTY